MWAAPAGNVKARCLERKKALDKLVRSVITRERASDAFFTHCFPNAVLVEAHQAAHARQKQQAESQKHQEQEQAKSHAKSASKGAGATTGPADGRPIQDGPNIA